jgi:hypothetical protein
MPEEQTPKARNAPSEYTRTVNGQVKLDVRNCYTNDIDAGEITLTRGGKEITRAAKWCVQSTNLREDGKTHILHACNTKQDAITFLLTTEQSMKDLISDEEE